MRKQLLYTLTLCIFTAFFCTSCSEEEEWSTRHSSVEMLNREPIQFKVQALVMPEVTEVSSRSIVPDLQYTAFVPGTEIGLFILEADRYRHIQATGFHATVDSSALSQYLTPKVDEYENVRAVVQADGSLKVNSPGIDMLYYPVNGAEVGVIAYSPYCPDYTLQQLVLGCRVQVPNDQSMPEGQLAGDFTVGTARRQMTFREKGFVQLEFLHRNSRIDVNVKLASRPELQCEEVVVNAHNVRTAYTVRPWVLLNNRNEAVELATAPQTGTVCMANIRKQDFALSADASYHQATCYALVIPELNRLDSSTQFSVTLKGRTNGRPDSTIVRTDKSFEDYLPGRGLSYSFTVD